MKRKTNIWLKKGAVFLLFLISITYILCSKIIAEGECVAINYYIPLSLKDYFAMSFIACVAIGLSYYLSRRHISKKLLIIEVLIYAIIVAIFCVYGDEFNASHEYDWPHTYHPTPYTK